MANSAVLVASSANRLRYKFTTTDNGVFTLPCAGGASPDILTDSLAGTIRKIAQVKQQGYGTLPPGSVTQAQARALWLSDRAGANIGNTDVQSARVRAVSRGTTGGAPANRIDVDADQVAGNPVLKITPPAIAAVYYIDIEIFGTIGA